ncbi:MAG TPA: nucleotide sugar dehydrogenase [Bdellovibrionota bacterium]|nr:nucleotide sugar dehydrogenase [Bdellovibrionota bacterium]
MASLRQKIDSFDARVAVIGLGYVGLPLAVDLAKAGFSVTGFDVSEDRVARINRGDSYIEDIPGPELTAVVKPKSGKGGFRATTDFALLREMDTVSICVPTPLGKTRDPDVSFILAVRDRLRESIHADMLVILESTTYPGTTEEIFEPLVKEAGLTLGKDFFLAFSPERIDPGNKRFQLRNTPKVIGGMTPACTETTKALYAKIIERLVPVASTRAAEMVKILENTFRAVNIGLVNEVAIMCRLLGIDTWEVIEAAATKPFGFTPFYPGPGLGGHCIPVDPHYLSWKLKTLNYTARFIDLAAEVNTGMPRHVVELVAGALNDAQKSVKGSRILLLGIAYKPDVSDVRESPALDIFRLLQEKGANVSYHDPLAPDIRLDGLRLQSIELSDKIIAAQDVVVITTHHSQYDFRRIVEHALAVVDTRNATKGIQSPKVVRL